MTSLCRQQKADQTWDTIIVQFLHRDGSRGKNSGQGTPRKLKEVREEGLKLIPGGVIFVKTGI